jgi:hypothetical protein
MITTHKDHRSRNLNLTKITTIDSYYSSKDKGEAKGKIFPRQNPAKAQSQKKAMH